MTNDDARMTRQASVVELVLSLARTTPAFQIPDWTIPSGRTRDLRLDEVDPDPTAQRLFVPNPKGQTAREFLLGLFAPSAARRTLTSSQDKLLRREVDKINSELSNLYRRLGPPPGWTGPTDGE
jgi:hypothetical protein